MKLKSSRRQSPSRPIGLIIVLLATIWAPRATRAQQQQQRRTNPPAAAAAAPVADGGDWMAQAPETDSVVLQIDADPTGGGGDRRLDGQALVLLLKSTALSDPA